MAPRRGAVNTDPARAPSTHGPLQPSLVRVMPTPARASRVAPPLWLFLGAALAVWVALAVLVAVATDTLPRLGIRLLAPGAAEAGVRGVLSLAGGLCAALLLQAHRHREEAVAVLDALDAEIAVLDPGGRITWVNRAWIRTGAARGADPGGYVGRRYLDGIDPESVEDEDTARFLRELEAVLAGDRDEFSLDYPFREPGGRRWFRASVRALRSEGARGGAVVAHVDVTAQKMAHAASVAQELRFRRAVDQAPFPTLLHAEDGEILRVNRAWIESTGWEPADLPSLEAWARLASDDAAAFLARFRGHLEGGEIHRSEDGFVIRTRSGRERIWDLSSVALGHLEDGRRLVLSMAADVTGRARAEAATARARDELRAVFDASPAPIVTLATDGTVRRWNPAASELFGWTVDEARGRYPPFVPPDRMDDFRANVARVVAGRPLRNREVQRLARDGRELAVSLSAAPILDEAGAVTGVAAIVVDVTDRKQTEDQLRRLNRSLRILGATNRAVARGSEPRRLLADICATTVEVGGHRGAWVALKPTHDGGDVLVAARHGADLPPAADPAGMPGVCAALDALEGEAVVRDASEEPDCACPPALVSPHPAVAALPLSREDDVAGVLVVLAGPGGFGRGDVDDLKEMAREVGRGLAVASTYRDLRLLRTAIESLDLGISIADQGQPGHPLVFANEGLARMTGVPARELLGRPPHFLEGDDDERSEEDRAALAEAVRTGHPIQRAVPLRRRSGERYWDRVTLDSVRDESGAVSHVVAVEEDVTERRRMGRELKHRERLSALGQLAGGVAHDIRNLLTAVGGLVDLSLRDGEDAESTRANLLEIKALLPRSRSVLNRLLSFSRREDLDAQEIDLRDALGDAVKLLKSVFRDDVRASLEMDGPAWVRIDPGQFQQLVLNVAVNSQHAMPDGGHFRVTCRTDQSDVALPPEAREWSSGAAQRWVWVSMEDTGAGMHPETVARAFEPFFTTKETGQGTGLGLASCYGLVNGSGGHIWLESEPGHGTTLHFVLPRLPLAAVRTEPEAPDPRAEEPERGAPLEILLAEDEQAIRETFRRFLEREGHRVRAAADGAEAWEIFQEAPDRPALILTDAMMPRMSGIELSRRILERRPDLPVILISGYVSRELPELPRAERVRLLHKPFDLADLRQVVAEMTRKSG